MSLQNEEDQKAIKIFKKKKVITLNQLSELLNCSKRTVQRRLSKWGTYTSYNHNGRYYIFKNIPNFDENGLWSYKGICFSKSGNLNQTISMLVNNSQSGLTVLEAGKIIGVPLSSFMSQDRNANKLRKEKIGREFVHFSCDETIYNQQKQNRQEHEKLKQLTRLPSDAESIIILVELIRHPHMVAEELSKKLNSQGCQIRSETIRNLLEYHGLEKKTTDI
ncbi:MAG: HTH domain-containing protein [Bacteroidetes bacterium]|nr:HTH domain-containing protein [Bacteroidota bacterium]